MWERSLALGSGGSGWSGFRLVCQQPGHCLLGLDGRVDGRVADRVVRGSV